MSSDIVFVILLLPNSKSQEAYKKNICFRYYHDYQLKDNRENRLFTLISLVACKTNMIEAIIIEFLESGLQAYNQSKTRGIHKQIFNAT